MSPADLRKLAAAIVDIELRMLDLPLELDLDEAGIVALRQWWREHVDRFAAATPGLAKALAELEIDP